MSLELDRNGVGLWVVGFSTGYPKSPALLVGLVILSQEIRTQSQMLQMWLVVWLRLVRQPHLQSGILLTQ